LCGEFLILLFKDLAMLNFTVDIFAQGRKLHLSEIANPIAVLFSFLVPVELLFHGLRALFSIIVPVESVVLYYRALFYIIGNRKNGRIKWLLVVSNKEDALVIAVASYNVGGLLLFMRI
jgi:hypothetical protein